MSIETVREYFKQWNIEHRVLEAPISSATVEKAALAFNCKEKEIAKTMSFKINGNAILIVMAGDAKINNQKYKATFGTKAVMLKADELEDMIGHSMGGVCPFAIKDGVEVYLDESLKRFETVYPAAGSSNSGIPLSIEELEKYSNFKEWVDVAKDWE